MNQNNEIKELINSGAKIGNESYAELISANQSINMKKAFTELLDANSTPPSPTPPQASSSENSQDE